MAALGFAASLFPNLPGRAVVECQIPGGLPFRTKGEVLDPQRATNPAPFGMQSPKGISAPGSWLMVKGGRLNATWPSIKADWGAKQSRPARSDGRRFE